RLSAAATAETYTLPLHDALPICRPHLDERLRVEELALDLRPRLRSEDCPQRQAEEDDRRHESDQGAAGPLFTGASPGPVSGVPRSEEHTSELQSRENLVCRLLLE